jgi:carbonic anhydrase
MSGVTWLDALDRLKTGNLRFESDAPRGLLRDRGRRAELAGGQRPFAIVLTCSDSRVAPELAFDVGLGELFVIRVGGNVPSPSSIASVEFPVTRLGIKLIVVMAHESCDAVRAAMRDDEAGPHMNHLLGFIRPAVESSEDNSLDAVVRLNARNTAAALVRESEILRSAVDGQGVRIMTAYYCLESGRVEFDD